MKKNKLIAAMLFFPVLATGVLAVPAKAHHKLAATGIFDAPKRYNIAENGAVGDGTTLNTKAIQATIDKCA